MRETWQDRIIGGVIAIAVTVIGALIISWWNSPSDQSGIILVTDNDFTERTRSVDGKSGKQLATLETFAHEYEFYNLKGELKNFSILIPAKSDSNAPIIVETEQNGAVLRSISKFSEIQALGTVKLEVQSIDKGGYISVRIKSPSRLRISIAEEAQADVKTIQILSPRSLPFYL